MTRNNKHENKKLIIDTNYDTDDKTEAGKREIKRCLDNLNKGFYRVINLISEGIIPNQGEDYIDSEVPIIYKFVLDYVIKTKIKRSKKKILESKFSGQKEFDPMKKDEIRTHTEERLDHVYLLEEIIQQSDISEENFQKKGLKIKVDVKRYIKTIRNDKRKDRFYEQKVLNYVSFIQFERKYIEVLVEEIFSSLYNLKGIKPLLSKKELEKNKNLLYVEKKDKLVDLEVEVITRGNERIGNEALNVLKLTGEPFIKGSLIGENPIEFQGKCGDLYLIFRIGTEENIYSRKEPESEEYKLLKAIQIKRRKDLFMKDPDSEKVFNALVEYSKELINPP